jgi:threonine dehydrogenase-like Zn-dependent dehydrogenase|tara:strand:- start:170 stop:1120 length:951 start_codon:yes stop_codon:yes gene_type:complete
VKALYINRAMELRDVPLPSRPNECRVRVLLAGICGTDLQILNGYAAFKGVPGHEFVGIVEDVSSDTDGPLVGRRVVGEINVGCDNCRWCQDGIKEHCPARSVLGIRHRFGAFAEYLWLPPSNLHVLPESLGESAAVFVEPTAAACQILTQTDMTRSDHVIVLGDGRMGLIIGQVLATTCAQVTIAGKHENKLEVARKLGLNATHVDSLDGSQKVDVVVEATGRPDGLPIALKLLRPRGTVVLKSTFHGETSMSLWPTVIDEFKIIGSRCGPFPPAIDHLASGRVDTTPLIAGTFGLEDYESAFEAARNQLKVLLRP